MMNTRYVAVWVSLMCLPAMGQVTSVSSVVDGAGRRSAVGSWTHISAVAQPGGMTVTAGGDLVHYAGFINTFSLFPGLDTDEDGLANEVDSDNDADGLSDYIEITGAAFVPVTPTDMNQADSDEDGTPDGDEAVAGTNPADSSALLQVVSLDPLEGGRKLTWQARGSHERTYVVKTAPAAGEPYHAVIFSNTVAGGIAPWYTVHAAVTDSSSEPHRIYAVEVLP